MLTKQLSRTSLVFDGYKVWVVGEVDALSSTDDLSDRKIKKCHISNTARGSRADPEIDTVPKEEHLS